MSVSAANFLARDQKVAFCCFPQQPYPYSNPNFCITSLRKFNLRLRLTLMGFYPSVGSFAFLLVVRGRWRHRVSMRRSRAVAIGLHGLVRILIDLQPRFIATVNELQIFAKVGDDTNF